MKKLLLIISFICAVNSLKADVLFLNEGEEFIGNLKKIDENNIGFQKLNATDTETFNIKDVAHILISKNRTGDEISSIEQINDPIAQKILKNLPNPADYTDSDYIRKECFQAR